MRTFEDLGLEAALVQHLRELGYQRPTPLQDEAAPVVGRGTNAVGIAGAGSGKTAAYGLGLTLHLDADDPALQALVIRPTDDAAAATAESLHTLTRPAGLTVALVRPNRPPEAASAQIVVASPAAALDALENSTIKLETLQTLVVDGASAILELGGGEAFETVTAHMPRDAQRVVLSARDTPEVSDWVERHARRARRLVTVTKDVEPLPNHIVECLAAPSARWLPILTQLIDSAASKGADHSSILCRSRTEGDDLEERLAVRGFRIAESPAEPGVRIIPWEAPEERSAELTVFWGAPFDVLALRKAASDSQRLVVFLAPAELSHLHQLTSAIETRLTTLRTPAPPEAQRSAQATRDRLREAVQDEDLEPYLLLLEPLFDEFSPAQIAAAATALLREETPTAAAPGLPAWTRLYVGAGRRDGVRPADIVGAITGEAAVSGDQIGRIEIRDTHSLVEIAATVAEQVIRALAGATIRGRPANVRVYRE